MKTKSKVYRRPQIARNFNKLLVVVLLVALATSSPVARAVPQPQIRRVMRHSEAQQQRDTPVWPVWAVSRLLHITEVVKEKVPKWKDQSDDISAPVIIVPMIAVPPREIVAGSTKGLPYKVRIVHPHKRASHGIARTFGRRQTFGTGPHLPVNASDINEYKGETMDLHGGIVGVGEYFSIVEIGGKEMRVQVDTGSSTLAVPMEGCRSCSRQSNRRYSLLESANGRAVSCDSDQCAAGRCSSSCPICSRRGACCSAERPKECGFSLRYADGSTLSGSLIQDEMVWGTLRCNVTFGGILRNSANFERSEVDGILGMAYQSLACNPSCFDPPFDALVKNRLVDDVFSICMTSTGGKLMLGGYDHKVAKSEVRYVDMTHFGMERYYRVSLGGQVWIGEERVWMPNFRTAIVDTGTTLIVMSTKTFKALREAFQKRYCNVPELCEEDSWFQSGMCVSLSDEDMKLLPTLTMEVGGSVRLSLRPTDYLLKYERDGKSYRCVGIMGMDGLGGMVVLGNTLMQRYVTVYDRRRGRIGFAEAAAQCGD
ncbi:Cathepsin D [Gracilariopsis chorda]|uniref:Cathepsin D n=1 Tax=Gracilariopsis chorda TaxID=448386 RepID=A0A2V3IKR2_9FLOR|nr:Cathepsin D [Gracilariopsis chorda]|eukprot:PXF42676.1 Cathepsin D [Gracilariopsis chorda]